MTDFLNNQNISIGFISSSRLYSQPKFWDGISTIFNIMGSSFNYNYSKSNLEADNKSIKRDWEIVGNDMWNAINSNQENTK